MVSSQTPEKHIPFADIENEAYQKKWHDLVEVSLDKTRKIVLNHNGEWKTVFFDGDKNPSDRVTINPQTGEATIFYQLDNNPRSKEKHQTTVATVPEIVWFDENISGATSADPDRQYFLKPEKRDQSGNIIEPELRYQIADWHLSPDGQVIYQVQERDHFSNTIKQSHDNVPQELLLSIRQVIEQESKLRSLADQLNGVVFDKRLELHRQYAEVQKKLVDLALNVPGLPEMKHAKDKEEVKAIMARLQQLREDAEKAIGDLEKVIAEERRSSLAPEDWKHRDEATETEAEYQERLKKEEKEHEEQKLWVNNLEKQVTSDIQREIESEKEKELQKLIKKKKSEHRKQFVLPYNTRLKAYNIQYKLYTDWLAAAGAGRGPRNPGNTPPQKPRNYDFDESTVKLSPRESRGIEAEVEQQVWKKYISNFGQTKPHGEVFEKELGKRRRRRATIQEFDPGKVEDIPGTQEKDYKSGKEQDIVNVVVLKDIIEDWKKDYDPSEKKILKPEDLKNIDNKIFDFEQEANLLLTNAEALIQDIPKNRHDKPTANYKDINDTITSIIDDIKINQKYLETLATTRKPYEETVKQRKLNLDSAEANIQTADNTLTTAEAEAQTATTAALNNPGDPALEAARINAVNLADIARQDRDQAILDRDQAQAELDRAQIDLDNVNEESLHSARVTVINDLREDLDRASITLYEKKHADEETETKKQVTEAKKQNPDSLIEQKDLSITIPYSEIQNLLRDSGKVGKAGEAVQSIYKDLEGGLDTSKETINQFKSIFGDSKPVKKELTQMLRKYGITDWKQFKELWDDKLAEQCAKAVREAEVADIQRQIASAMDEIQKAGAFIGKKLKDVLTVQGIVRLALVSTGAVGGGIVGTLALPAAGSYAGAATGGAVGGAIAGLLEKTDLLEGLDDSIKDKAGKLKSWTKEKLVNLGISKKKVEPTSSKEEQELFNKNKNKLKGVLEKIFQNKFQTVVGAQGNIVATDFQQSLEGDRFSAIIAKTIENATSGEEIKAKLSDDKEVTLDSSSRRIYIEALRSLDTNKLEPTEELKRKLMVGLAEMQDKFTEQSADAEEFVDKGWLENNVIKVLDSVSLMRTGKKGVLRGAATGAVFSSAFLAVGAIGESSMIARATAGAIGSASAGYKEGSRRILEANREDGWKLIQSRLTQLKSDTLSMKAGKLNEQDQNILRERLILLKKIAHKSKLAPREEMQGLVIFGKPTEDGQPTFTWDEKRISEEIMPYILDAESTGILGRLPSAEAVLKQLQDQTTSIEHQETDTTKTKERKKREIKYRTIGTLISTASGAAIAIAVGGAVNTAVNMGRSFVGDLTAGNHSTSGGSEHTREPETIRTETHPPVEHTIEEPKIPHEIRIGTDEITADGDSLLRSEGVIENKIMADPELKNQFVRSIIDKHPEHIPKWMLPKGADIHNLTEDNIKEIVATEKGQPGGIVHGWRGDQIKALGGRWSGGGDSARLGMPIELKAGAEVEIYYKDGSPELRIIGEEGGNVIVHNKLQYPAHSQTPAEAVEAKHGYSDVEGVLEKAEIDARAGVDPSEIDWDKTPEEAVIAKYGYGDVDGKLVEAEEQLRATARVQSLSQRPGSIESGRIVSRSEVGGGGGVASIDGNAELKKIDFAKVDSTDFGDTAEGTGGGGSTFYNSEAQETTIGIKTIVDVEKATEDVDTKGRDEEPPVDTEPDELTEQGQQWLDEIVNSEKLNFAGQLRAHDLISALENKFNDSDFVDEFTKKINDGEISSSQDVRNYIAETPQEQVVLSDPKTDGVMVIGGYKVFVNNSDVIKFSPPGTDDMYLYKNEDAGNFFIKDVDGEKELFFKFSDTSQDVESPVSEIMKEFSHSL